MGLKILTGIIAMLLTIGFLAPPVIKLKDPALLVVMLIGVTLMALDLWQSLHEKDD